MVLLMTERGLSLAQIGLCVTVFSIVTVTLELPTGGLADALGHRPVLVLAGLMTTAGLLLLTVADSTALFALAWALKGVGRALDSGPLEAWYVDAVRAADAEADVTPGLSRAGAADGAVPDGVGESARGQLQQQGHRAVDGDGEPDVGRGQAA